MPKKDDLVTVLEELEDLVDKVLGTPREKVLASCLRILVEEYSGYSAKAKPLPSRPVPAKKDPFDDGEEFGVSQDEFEDLAKIINEARARRKNNKK